MGEIKSAAEIAREKIEKLGAVTEEERRKWKYVPEGEKLAARYIKEGCNLPAELEKYGAEARQYVVKGASDILIRNIGLPTNDIARMNNKKAMAGLKAVKNDKVAVENIFSRIRHVLDHYLEQGEQQRKQAYESLKAEFGARIQQALQQQTGINTNMNIDVTRQPQFQEEWKKLQAQMDAQYLNVLNECKRELAAIA